MNKKFAISFLAIIVWALAIFFVLRNENALLAHPKGIIAQSQLDLIVTNIILMLLIVAPTFIAFFAIAWKYRTKAKAAYNPKNSQGVFRELILWLIPVPIVALMTVVTWFATHKLDPYQPLKSDVKPLTIQVVALNWKWLFIYPEQGIATVNFVQFPALTPINFRLSADSSPMNSFWIPQLSGQIYSMTGMVTPLHIMANEPGEYLGRAAEINGEGFADMTFVAKATTQSDFEKWVEQVKKSPGRLNHSVYSDLVKPSINHPVALYSFVEKDLFNKIVMP